MRLLSSLALLCALASCGTGVRVTSVEGPAVEIVGTDANAFALRACHVDPAATGFLPPELQISATFGVPSIPHPAARARMVVRRDADFLMDDAALGHEGAELELTFDDLYRGLGSALCTESTEVTFDAPSLPAGASVSVEWMVDARSQEDLDAEITVE